MLQPATPLPAVPAAAPARAPAAPAPASTATDIAPGIPNPRLRIDPALSLVVIEFRDSAGEVSLSLPSPKELEAYRDQPRPELVPSVDVSR